MPLWNEIEGQTLDGLPLHTLLRSEGRTAWFSTTDKNCQPAVISVFEALNDEDAEQSRLRTAAAVQHPGLLVIRSIGAARLEDESLVYAVMEPFDQTLAEVLRDRTLAPEETREVAESLLSALEAVEAAGLRHGHVDAAGVVGVGDQIKLRSDCLASRQGPGDAAALAAMLYNALTGRRFSSERDALQLPAPFATLVRAGAGNNGSLAAMRRVLNVGSANAAPSAAASASPAGSATAEEAATAAAASSRTPAPAHATAIPRAALRRDEEPTRRKRPGVTIAALVVMLIVLAIFWYASKRPARHTPISGEAAPATSQPAAKSAATADVPPAAAPVGNTAGAMGAPETVAPAPRPSAATPSPAAPATGGERNVWHVVVYTYVKEEAAQQKATELAAQYPQLEPQVFSPTGHAPYLVALGGGMSRENASSRRQAALAAGLPRDTYMQNYRK